MNMRSIKHRFDEIAVKRPGLSTYMCFAKAVRYQKYNQSMIRRWFKKLVDKEDYDASENKTVHYPHFYSLTQEKEARGLPVAGGKLTQEAKRIERGRITHGRGKSAKN